MKCYNKNIESLNLMYLHAINMYGWAMFQKLPLNGIKCKKIYVNLMKSS